MSYIPVYVEPSGPGFWIERGKVSWPKVLHEAANMARELGGDVMSYEGIVKDARVSDEQDWVHADDDGCADSQGVAFEDPAFVPCCRTVEAYAFTSVER